eukprot:8532388-Pyramimonas_sp.AAC.1
MEGGPFSKCGSRFSVAHIRSNHVQDFIGLRPSGFQTAVLAFEPRTLRSFGALQEYHELRARRFQYVVLVSAPRTFALNTCKRFTD